MCRNATNTTNLHHIFNKNFSVVNQLCEEDHSAYLVSKRNLNIKKFSTIKTGMDRDKIKEEAFLEASLHSMAEGSGEGGGAGGAEDDGDRHVDEAKSGNEELFENGGEATTSWGVDGRRAVRASRARASLNPGDVILDLACGLHATQLTTAFERSEGKAALATAIAELVRSSAGATATSANSVAWFHTQVLVLSQQLLRKAVRHPMLLTLHYGGSVFMAVTLGSIFADMHYDFDGAQDRIGVLFFILAVLALIIFKEKNSFIRGVKNLKQSQLAVLSSIILVIFTKTIDGAERKFGIEFSPSGERFALIVEEVGEMGIPIMFSIAILSWRNKNQT